MYMYQIEISNYCSLSCAYCPYHMQKRLKGMMSFETFKKCVQVFKECENEGKLFLHNFGEPLLNPNIFEFIYYASANNVECSFFTNGMDENGNPFSRDIYKKLRACGMKSISFSAHKLSVEMFKNNIGDLLNIDSIFIPEKNKLGNWGGQICGFEQPEVEGKCIFEKKNCFVVLWDGSIASCCIDVEGNPRKYHINDLIISGEYQFSKIPLCGTCAAMREDEKM